MMKSLLRPASFALAGSLIVVSSLLTGLPAWAQAQSSSPAAVSPAKADERVVLKLSTEELKALMSDEGYAVTIDGDGDLIWKIDGYRALMVFGKDHESIQFRAAFGDGNATLRKVNDWNKRVKYSRSYLDNEDNPVLELDLDLAGGVTRARILDFLHTCRISFSAWQSDVVR